MLASGIPAKFSIPWANAAGGGFIRVPPVASQIGIHDGWASFADGFPPLTFNAVAAGGVPPFGQDMNGVVNLITAWQRWVQAGGAMPFDATFAAAVSGYPNGAIVPSSLGHALWHNLADSNSANPDSGGANWQLLVSAWSNDIRQAGGSANAQTLTLRPACTNLAQLTNLPITFLSQGVNTGGVTLNVNGLGARNILGYLGQTLTAGALTAQTPVTVVSNGSSYIMVSPNPYKPVALADFTTGTNANGTWWRRPDGMIIQAGARIPATGNGDLYNLPTSFVSGATAGSSSDDGGLMADTSVICPNASQIKLWCGYNNGGTPSYIGGSVGVLWMVIGV